MSTMAQPARRRALATPCLSKERAATSPARHGAETDPRVEGFIAAISAYFGIPACELNALWMRRPWEGETTVRSTPAVSPLPAAGAE